MGGRDNSDRVTPFPDPARPFVMWSTSHNGDSELNNLNERGKMNKKNQSVRVTLANIILPLWGCVNVFKHDVEKLAHFVSASPGVLFDNFDNLPNDMTPPTSCSDHYLWARIRIDKKYFSARNERPNCLLNCPDKWDWILLHFLLLSRELFAHTNTKH